MSSPDPNRVEAVYEDWRYGQLTKDFIRQTTRRRFEVDVNTVEATEFDVESALGTATEPDALPKRNQAHPLMTNYVATAPFDIRRLSETTFEVIVPYELPFMSYIGAPEAYYEDPLAVPPQVIVRPIKLMEPVDVDIKGDPLQNSAKQDFDPPLMGRKRYWEITIIRNERTFELDTAEDYMDSINTDEFRIVTPQFTGTFGPFSCLMDNILPEPVPFGGEGGYFIRVTYTIWRRRPPTYWPLGWVRRVLDQGTRQLNAGGTDYEAITGSDGKTVRGPVRLDGAGRKRAVSADPVFLEKHVDKEKAWAPLGFIWPG